MQDFEKLGIFYLGQQVDPRSGESREDLVLYESRDLCTHGLCVGMTGSGKTGLCLALLEEAAIDGIPAIALDPKGDLGNLLLSFPELRAEDFRPWIEEGEAARAGRTPDEHAAATAEAWRAGLAASGQTPERIARFREACDLAIYTPGSNAGLSLSLLKSFAPPPGEAASDPDLLRERVAGTVSGLLGLLGIEADPLQSREHILFSLLLERAWKEGRSLSLAELVREVQQPPLERVGVLDLESFFPSRDRAGLALRLNNLLAAPGFQAWTVGDPLDIQRLLWTEDGKPRISILSIAHLSDAERMFFVTLLLEELLGWMRTQSGTSSLRALFYMDEIFGYFPPSANPPSKTPLLTLLKQARAYGLGCMLATQNPVDLDYKGLANCGTWFLGRLQTERDKLRVLDGLEGATSGAGQTFDRAEADRILSGLGKRTFLLHDVHAPSPLLFRSRWALSYLRGPLTRTQIATLMEPRKATVDAAGTPAAVGSRRPAPHPEDPEPSASTRPVVPAGVTELFLPPLAETPPRYRPALLGQARVHFFDRKLGVDAWRSVALLAELRPDGGNPWESAEDFDDLDGLETDSRAEALFAALPVEAQRDKTYDSWSRSLAQHLYRTRTLPLLVCPAVKVVARVDERRADFLARVRQVLREERDAAVEALRVKYKPRLARLEDKIRRAEERVRRETVQYESQRSQSLLAVGSSLLRALFGRKLASSANVGRATSAARSVDRAARQKGDIAAAEKDLEAAVAARAELEAELAAEVTELGTLPEPEAVGLVENAVKPRKSDTVIERVALVWVP